MSAPEGVVATQIDALLELVEKHRRERCREIRERAEAQRHTLLQQAYRDARRAMHEAVVSERRRTQQKITATRAQLQTQMRQAKHKAELLLLHEGWEQLSEAVLERWKAPESRRIWIKALLKRALVALPARAWEVAHPPGCNPEEEIRCFDAVTEQCGEPPRFVADEQLHAGLRICAGGACLDGTLEGLLADRVDIEAQLLARFHRLQRSAAERGKGAGAP